MYQVLIPYLLFQCFLHFPLTQQFYSEQRASLMFALVAGPWFTYMPLLATAGRENVVPGHQSPLSTSHLLTQLLKQKTAQRPLELPYLWFLN